MSPQDNLKKMQKNFIIFIVIAIVLIGGVAFYKTGSAPTVENPNPGSTTTSQGSETINPGQNTGNTTTTGTQTGTNKTFTLAEVTAKNSKAACWSIVNGSVYDLTNWIGKHPGGQKPSLKFVVKMVVENLTDNTEAKNNQKVF